MRVIKNSLDCFHLLLMKMWRTLSVIGFCCYACFHIFFFLMTFKVSALYTSARGGKKTYLRLWKWVHTHKAHLLRNSVHCNITFVKASLYDMTAPVAEHLCSACLWIHIQKGRILFVLMEFKQPSSIFPRSYVKETAGDKKFWNWSSIHRWRSTQPVIVVTDRFRLH